MEFQVPFSKNPDKIKKMNKYEVRKTSFDKQRKGINYVINFDDDIADPFEYREIVTTLREAKESDIIQLHISSWGGYLDAAVLIVNELLLTKAKTIAIIHTAGSAATLIAFACDQVETFPISTIMIHNFSVSQSGKGQEVRAKAEFDEKQFSTMCDLLYTGILTEEEIKAMQEDKDMWLLGSELKERMAKYEWKPVRERGRYACV